MTNKKFKLAAMSLALTACVAASPLAANAESTGTGADSSAPAPAAAAEVPGENAPATNENDPNAANNGNQNATDDDKQDADGDDKQNVANNGNQNTADNSNQNTADNSNQNTADNSNQNTADNGNQDADGDDKQDADGDDKQDADGDDKQDADGDDKQGADGDDKQGADGDDKQDAANNNEQDAAIENKALAAATPVAKAPVLMTTSLAATPTAPTAPAEAKTVATITKAGTTTNYTSFDAAVKAAQDNDIIEVVEDTETTGIVLDNKKLTIQGVKKATKTNDDGTVEETTVKPKLKFVAKEGQPQIAGITLRGSNLTFQNMDVNMTGVSSTADNDWNAICMSGEGNAALTLNNTKLLMDGEGLPAGKQAIYMDGHGRNELNVDDHSTLTIKNYPHNAITWNGVEDNNKNSTYFINITDGSTLTIDKNLNGIIGTIDVTVDDSTLNVTNSRGNGANGSNYDIKNGSNVNFSGNGSHGLSAGTLEVTGGSTVTANDNRYIGIAVGQTANITDSTVTANNNGWMGIRLSKASNFTNSDVTIKGTKGTSTFNSGIRLFKGNASLTVDGGTLTIEDNAVTGIFCDSGSQLTIEDTANVTITDNTAAQKNCTSKQDLAQKGGGLVVRGGASAKLGANTTINNNSAALEGADIFIEAGGTLTFSAGNAGIGDILKDCGDGIDGWYIDAEGQRWNFHGDPSVAQKLLDSKDVALVYNRDGTYTITTGREGLALKAAHAELPAPEPDPNPNPNPDPEPKPDPKPGPDTPVTPEDPQLPPVQDARVDTPDSPVLPANPTNPAVQDAHALPQTGTSLFAALAMALSGFALTLAGAWASLLGKNSRH